MDQEKVTVAAVQPDPAEQVEERRRQWRERKAASRAKAAEAERQSQKGGYIEIVCELCGKTSLVSAMWEDLGCLNSTIKSLTCFKCGKKSFVEAV
jgi:hypothetical protein